MPNKQQERLTFHASRAGSIDDTTYPHHSANDDNAIQAATRQTILKRVGYFVIAVLNPQRALDQIRAEEFVQTIDMVITDHLMPGINGSTFVKALRETHPELPVLVISGLEEAEAEYAGLNIVFRLKPVNPENLLASVHSMLVPGDNASDPAQPSA